MNEDPRTRGRTRNWPRLALSLHRGCVFCFPLHHSSSLDVQTGAYVVFFMLLHKLRFRQIKDLPVLKCLAAGGCLETDRSTVAGTRASHGLRMTSRGTYVHRLPHM